MMETGHTSSCDTLIPALLILHVAVFSCAPLPGMRSFFIGAKKRDFSAGLYAHTQNGRRSFYVARNF